MAVIARKVSSLACSLYSIISLNIPFVVWYKTNLTINYFSLAQAVQNTSAPTETIIQSNRENFREEVNIEEDFGNLWEDELNAFEDIFLDEDIPEVLGQTKTKLDKKEAESNVIKKCNLERDSRAPLKGM